jgi:hypothetical protein
MKLRIITIALTSAVFAACATSPADEGGSGGGGGKADGESSCPVEGDAEKVLDAIERGGNCYTAVKIAESCAWGSSIDVQFVSAATDVCARGFSAMSADAKTDYKTLVERCGGKYANEPGTLYRSMAAFCQLEVTSFFNTLYPEPETSQPAVPYTATCPAPESDPEKIQQAIAGAASCSQAADVAEACAWGSSIDVQFVATASETCAGSLSAMTAADKALRDKLGNACVTALSEEGGTLGQSMIAFCQLHVDVVFDALYAPVE